ncbi:MAG: rubrerythrin family protein [Candidatus Aminicenantes bacterium]|nr:rubrerythrin family protein [Candidatus Aminicenantes bacterium]
MKKRTEDNLKNAFAGESQAHMKYLAFAEQAVKDNLPNAARMFRANSFAEQIHAVNHLRALNGIGRTGENLAAAMSGEAFEATTMYPEYVKQAEADGEKAAVMTTNQALAAEKVHYEMYKAAGQTVALGKDAGVNPIHVCGVCGFTMEGDAPDKCPVCGAPRAKFVKF